MAGSGTLFVVATPIGNVDDLSPRALRVLSETPVLACEDTRHTGVLLKRLGIPHGNRRFVALYDANEASRTPMLLKFLEGGQDCALVSNAGTPLISDPGYRLVAAARNAGVPVVPIPGPCAAIAALSAAGLPTDRFTFFGFMPPKPGRRTALLASLTPEHGTVIFHVPARMVKKVISELVAVHPECRVVIARELTKVFEEFVAGTPRECLESLGDREPKGEVTLLLNLRSAAGTEGGATCDSSSS